MDDKTVKDLFKQLKFLEAEQSQGWTPHWQDIGNYILPNRWFDATSGEKPNQGEKRNSSILNNTAKRALDVMASGMHGGLTSPSRPWFRLVPVNHRLKEIPAVKDYLAECERILYFYLANSNFYTCVHNVYTDLIGFGTALLYCLEDEDLGLRFRVGTVGTYYLSEGNVQLVDTVFRRYWMTARQVVERFGNAPSDAVKKQAQDNPFSWVQLVHVIRPRKQRDSRRADNQNMPYESIYFEYAGNNTLLRKSGYQELPFFASRWSTSGSDVYGRSPGMDALPDVKTLQEMERTYLMAVHKVINPPMRVPDRLKGKLSLIPGSINIAEENETVKPLYEIRPDLGAADAKIEKKTHEIQSAFFNDVFIMIQDNPNMTATEVIKRNEEKMVVLGPVVERQFFEFLNPCLDRSWGILSRLGALPEPPDEARGQSLKPEYISLLAQAQKAVATQAVDRVVGVAQSLAQTHPEVLDKIDADEVVDQYAELVNAPPGVVRDDAEVATIREQRAQAQAEAAEQERLAAEQERINQGVQAMRDLGNTPVGDGTALDLAGEVGAE